MNKYLKTLLLLIIIYIPIVLYAQDNLKFKKYEDDPDFYPGYIIDNFNNKIEGLIKDVSQNRSYHEVVFVTKEGKRTIYNPPKIKEYGSKSDKYLSNGEDFLKVIRSGKLVILCELTIMRPSGNGPVIPTTYSYFKKTNEKNFKSIPQGWSFTSFSKDIGAYFSDCESLSQKIENKEFKKNDLEEIVDFYNNNCGK